MADNNEEQQIPAEDPERDPEVGEQAAVSTPDTPGGAGTANSEPTGTSGRRLWQRRGFWLATGAGLAVLLVGLYVGGAAVSQDRIPRDTTVLGVDIGGMRAADAAQKLDQDLQPLIEEPLPVVLNDAEGQIEPEEAGLRFDAAATVDRLVGFTLSPTRLWSRFAGAGKATAVVKVDPQVLELTVEGLAPSFATPPKDGALTFADGKPKVEMSEEGAEVDVPAAAEKVAKDWLAGPRPLEFPSVAVEPEISDAEVARALEEDAEPLVAGPIKVQVDGQTATLEPTQLGDAASFQPDGTSLKFVLDGEQLAKDVREQLPDLESAPVEAGVKLASGKPKVTPSKPGSEVDHKVLAKDVVAAAHTEERTTQIEFKEVQPELTTEQAEALGVKERISKFAVGVTADPVRTENLRVGASKIDGVLVLPGETFSLLDTLGPITASNGFGNASVLVDGMLLNGMGGGLSQLATTLYNAVFFSGLEDVEHTPHSQYFSRYPEVREATIFVPYIDLKFKNNSDYGVLIESWVGDGELHVAFWSTKVWTIKSDHTGRREVVQPTVVTRSGSGCSPSGAGNPGFVATVNREFYKKGKLVKTEPYTWRYEPQNGIRCS